jgi:MFS family permease
MQILPIVVKALLGGLLVVAFAALAQTLAPKRFAGVFAAAPSVALAGLSVTLLTKGAADARVDCLGMSAGALGFVAYALLAPVLMRRWGTLKGSAAAVIGWAAVSAAALPAAAGAASAAAAVPPAVRRERDRPPLEFHPRKLRDTHAKDWWVRFGFGAGTSLVSALLSELAGPLIGGVFLAFPAILLASLTLVRQEEGRAASRDDARGAAWGALGLVAFALVGGTAFGGIAPVPVLALAVGAWVVVGLGSFLIAWALGAGADEDG